MSVFRKETADEILEGAHFTNMTFGGFINGKIIDSLIIGILCFIFMSIFGWEYTLLISCIIGITNIIPFFGPFIGAIPSALLLLMVDTRQCIYFIIFILLLQQFDGNILVRTYPWRFDRSWPASGYCSQCSWAAGCSVSSAW